MPCGPVAPAPGAGVDFTAMTTLSVLAGQHIVLAAGKVWGFVINQATTLPDGVTVRRPRDATAADFRNQLRILRLGQNLSGWAGPGPLPPVVIFLTARVAAAVEAAP